MDEIQQMEAQLPPETPDDLFSSHSHEFFALWLSGQGREDEAIAVYREAARRENSAIAWAYAHLNVGSSRFKQGKAAEAISEFKAAIDLKPNWATAFNGLGMALDQAGRYDEAIAAFQEVVRLSPDHHAARMHMGDAYTHKGDLPAALQVYSGSYLRPDAQICVANTLLALGECAEAVAVLLPLAEQYPNHAEVHLSAGRTLAAVGRIAEARQEWQNVLTIYEEFKADGLGDEEQDAMATKAQEYLIASA